jgi:PDZ domain-containing secreted protein
MQVGIVWDTTLDGKVKAGDQIIAIDEISYENIDVCDLITKESTNSKEKITLTTKNQAREIQKTIIEKNNCRYVFVILLFDSIEWVRTGLDAREFAIYSPLILPR